MNIAIASSGLGHVSRGVEAWAEDLAAVLHSKGIPTVLYGGAPGRAAPYRQTLPCWRRGDPRTLALQARLPRRVLWRFGLGGVYELEQSSFSWHLLRALRRNPADILHVQDPLIARRMDQARKLGFIRTRTILAHGTEESPEFLRRFPFVQHLAPFYLEEAKRTGMARPQWTAIPNFIDTNRFHPGPAPALRTELGIPENAFVVLTVAAIKRHHKRIDWLLDRFTDLAGTMHERSPHFVIAGGHEADTEALVAQGSARLGDRVRFLVRFPRERIPELYRAADLFVLASLHEMMPIALLEALASGLPALVHRDPVMEWMVGPGGRALDMEDPESLPRAIRELQANPAERGAWGAAAREHTVSTFGADRVVDRIIDYYKQVLRQ